MNRQPPSGVNPQFSSFNYTPGGFAPPNQPVHRQSQPEPRDYVHKRGVPGGGWDQDDDSTILRRPELFSSSIPSYPPPVVQQHMIPEPFKPQPPLPTQQYPNRPMERPKNSLPTSAPPGVHQRKLIQDITTPGGVRPRPSEKDLQDFSSKCKYLPCEVVMQILIEFLGEQPRTLKTLYVIDKLVSDYDSFRDAATRYGHVIGSSGQSPAHMRVIEPLMGKLGSARTQMEDILHFQLQETLYKQA